MKTRLHSSAFTLIEMFLVIAVIVVILTLSGMAYSSIVQAAAISQAADLVNQQFSEAHQDAVAQNTTVEVRLYKLAEPAGPTNVTVYRALQLHWLKSDGTTPAINPPSYLPDTVVIDATSTHSPIITSDGQTATPDTTDSNLNSDTRVFHFLADGTTDLGSTTNWFLTLRAATQSNASNFPSNWAAIRVDPTTGRAQIYRP